MLARNSEAWSKIGRRLLAHGKRVRWSDYAWPPNRVRAGNDPSYLLPYVIFMCAREIAICVQYKAQLSTYGPNADDSLHPSYPSQRPLPWSLALSLLLLLTPLAWPRQLLRRDGVQRYIPQFQKHPTLTIQRHIRWIGSNQHRPHLG